MNRQLLKSLIFQKINESILLTEDRIPSLISKWKGKKEILGGGTSPEPHLLVAGIKPSTETVAKLNPIDREMILHVSNKFDNKIQEIRKSLMDKTISKEEYHSRMTPYIAGGEEHTRAIVEKISEVDPSPGKEYTDKLLSWYSQSNEKPPSYNTHWGIASSNFVTDSHRQTMRSMITKGLAEKQKQQGFIGDRQPTTDDVSDEMVDKAFKIHFQQKEARLKHDKEERHDTKNPFVSENFGRAKDALEIYHKVKHLLPPEHRDFNKIHSLNHLESVVEPFKDYVSTSELEKKHKANVIYDDEHVTAYHVPTQEAACSLGAGTRWCVSAKNDNYFSSYNKSSPLIMFVDKKKQMNPHLSNPETKKNYKRYMFHFGDRISPNEDEPGYQFMDESDTPVDYKKFIEKFPQLKNIPQLQHLHPTAFQRDTPEQKQARMRTPQGLSDVLKHFEQYPQFHRKEHKADLLINHITLHKANDGYNTYELEDKNHPIINHYLPSTVEGYQKQDNQTKEMGETLVDKLLERSIKIPEHITRALIGAKPHLASKIADSTNDPTTHDIAYDALKKNKASMSGNYRFLRSTTNSKLLERAFKDASEFKIGIEHEHSKQKNTTGFMNLSSEDKPYLHETDVHHFIAGNEHTPDHILMQMIKKNPTSKKLDGLAKLKLDPTTGRFADSYETREVRTGAIALNTLLKKMEKRGGI